MLRIGILADSTHVPAWQSELIRLLLNTDYISTHLLLVVDSLDESTRRKPGQFFRLFDRYERSRNKALPDASATTPIKRLINEDDWLRVSSCPTYNVFDDSPQQNLTHHDLSTLHLDILLALGRTPSADNLCKIAKYGLWYFSHDYGQTAIADGSTVGFWETIKRRPHVYSALIISHMPRKNNLVAYESWSGIHHKSFYISRNEHLWKISFFVQRALKQMYSKGPEQYLSELDENMETERIRNFKRKYDLTNARFILPISLYCAWRLWQKILRKVYSERWILLFNASGNADDITNFKLLQPPDGRFWADPNVLYHKDHYYVFFEDASVDSGHGHISVIQLHSNGKASSPTNVLEKPYHLSYPFIFEWDNQLYMIPESAANRTVELYRCMEFPLNWEFVENLMSNVFAYDATLIKHEGIWWLFANVKQHTGASSWDELCLFYSDSPISTEWIPHPMNPIVSDVRSARPAGAFFRKDGHLYRPSQNSSNRYGYALNINKVIELTKTAYSEETIKTILPVKNRSITGIHTMNRTNNLVMIDAIYRVRRD